MRAVMLVAARGNENGSIVSSVMAGVAFAVEGDGVGFATESYAASALYTTLASLSGPRWRIRRVNCLISNISILGAAIEVNGAHDIPERFNLFFKTDDARIP